MALNSYLYAQLHQYTQLEVTLNLYATRSTWCANKIMVNLLAQKLLIDIDEIDTRLLFCSALMVAIPWLRIPTTALFDDDDEDDGGRCFCPEEELQQDVEIRMRTARLRGGK